MHGEWIWILIAFALVGLLFYGFIRLLMDILGKKNKSDGSVENHLQYLTRRISELENSVSLLKRKVYGEGTQSTPPTEAEQKTEDAKEPEIKLYEKVIIEEPASAPAP